MTVMVDGSVHGCLTSSSRQPDTTSNGMHQPSPGRPRPPQTPTPFRCAARASTARRRSSNRVAFIQNLMGRGHYELATQIPYPLRIAAAFTEPAGATDTTLDGLAKRDAWIAQQRLGRSIAVLDAVLDAVGADHEPRRVAG